MQKNIGGQKIGAQMITATTGAAFTGSVTVSVTGDAGTQATGSVGSGACTHEGNGYHTYAPAQAETNYDLIAFTFTGTGAIPATVQVFTTRQIVTMASGVIGDTGNDTTHLHLEGLAYADDTINDSQITILDSSTGLRYSTWIADWVNSTALATLGGTLPFTPQNDTDLYWVGGSVKDAPAMEGVALESKQDTIITDIATAQADLDIITGSDGVTLATAQANYAPATAANLAIVAGYLDTEIAAILADTNELQTDWADGGRLDVILDTAAAGGGSTLIITPVVGNSPNRGSGGEHKSLSGEDYLMTISGVDSAGSVIDFTALAAQVFVLEEIQTGDKLTISDGSITKTTTYARVTIPAAQNVADAFYRWAIRPAAGGMVTLDGTLYCARSAEVDV